MEIEEKLIQPGESKKIDLLNKRYWIVATLWEAAIGAGDETVASHLEQIAKAMPVADWMQDTRESQGEKLKVLLATYADLYNAK